LAKWKWNPKSITWGPNDGPQTAFLASTAREVLYGGAVGGGKSDALTVCDLRFADHPKHRSLYLRRTRPELQESIDRSLIIFPQIVPGAVWQEARMRWEMPSGAMYQYGFAEHEKDILKYKTFEYNVIKFDELTTFTEYQYLFMFLRNRKKSEDLPLWMRAGTNPGDVGHEFVFNRFINNRNPYQVYVKEVTLPDDTVQVVTQQFIPSTVWDNPALPDRGAYIAGIMQMSEDDQAAYLYGDWHKLAGAMFRTMPTEVERGIKSNDYYVVRAIDYGWDDMSCVLWAIVYGNGQRVEIVRELYINKCTIKQLCHYINAHEMEMGLKPAVMTPSSPEMGRTEGTSGISLQIVAAQNGVLVTPVKGVQSNRKAGWMLVQNWLVGGKVSYWPGACPNLLRTLPTLMRDPKKPDDLKARQQDHCADALRYLLTSINSPVETEPPPVDSRKGNPNFDQKFDKIVQSIIKPKSDFPGF
jgi:hypothetical protein